MAVNGINNNSPVTTAAGRTPARSIGDIDPNDFFRVLVAQLQQQDPLKPADNQALLQQMSMIRQLQSSTELQQTLSSLAAQQRMGTTASLIGKYVIGTANTASGPGAPPVQGVVVGVSYMANGQTILELHDGRQLPADRIESITLVDNLPGGAARPGGATPPTANTPPGGDSSPAARTKELLLGRDTRTRPGALNGGQLAPVLRATA